MKSMTGMGRAHGVVNGANVRIEIKSINHRFCDVNTRMPSRYLPLELLIQQFVRKTFSRGKIDVFLHEEKNPNLSIAEEEAYQACFTYLDNIRKKLNLSDEISLQDLTSNVGQWIQKDIDAEMVWKELLPVLQEAVNDLLQMREREGANLKKEMQALLGEIGDIVKKLISYKETIQEEVEEKLKEKIEARTQELGDLDENRLRMEVVYYLDRIDITEELHRLQSHLDLANEFLKKDGPVGRKIDFLLQEFNREFNTIGSKSQNSEVAHFVVEAKANLEKIREQIQNIE